MKGGYKINKMENKAILAILLIVSLLVGIFTGVILAPVKTNVIEVEKQVVVSEQVPYNDTEIKADVATIKLEVTEEDSWKSEALDLAVAELEDDDYENLFDFLVANNVSIVDKEDISRVVIKDSDVSGLDVEDKDADVSLELKVYFEDADGDDKKVYIDADYVIEDSDVEDEDFTLA
mgnify:CR=1 FL=1